MTRFSKIVLIQKALQKYNRAIKTYTSNFKIGALKFNKLNIHLRATNLFFKFTYNAGRLHNFYVLINFWYLQLFIHLMIYDI